MTQAAFSPTELVALRPLARQFPSPNAVAAELARMAGELVLPKGTVHVISDVHGDDVKLRHVINNASGTLRPLVEKLFAGRLDAEELQSFLTLLFYPRETLEREEARLPDEAARTAFARRVLRQLFDVLRLLARHSTLDRALRVFPSEYRAVLCDLLYQAREDLGSDYFDALTETLVRQGRSFPLIRVVVRVVRNLAIDELVLAGDFWDRGPRGDRVVEYLRRQPNVAITWGNHDAAWLGAALGHAACVAHVLRISLRYRRLSQLEEGYGVTLQPLEHLARTVYGDDPAACYVPKGNGLRETVQMARMQKAAAIMQFKLEGQMIQRHPEWALEHRRLLHHLDLQAGTIAIDGKTWPLRDRHFPTIDSGRPYELSVEEHACLERTRNSFLNSPQLWEHARYLVQSGAMWLERDGHLIFHACVPCDAKGEFLPFPVDGRPCQVRALFDALEAVVVRTLDRPSPNDLDLLWYLWCGPLSPLFGKDRITTLENDLVADHATHVETKNPYFQLLHEPWFCDKVLAEFDVDPVRGLIVNGHVPVKIEKGESPLKRSGKAITIDGAFSAAYGDHGYTLVLEPERTFLAKHHHFESVEAAVRDGVDIVPSVEIIRTRDRPRRVADTERGTQLRGEMAQLERLAEAYRRNRLRPA